MSKAQISLSSNIKHETILSLILPKTGELKMAYIRYHEVEKLFTAWPELEVILHSLSLDLIAVRTNYSMGTDDDYIYSLCMGNKAIDNMPPSGRISDSTGNIAANYGFLMWHDRRAVKTELTGDVLELSLVIEKMQLAFRRLSPLQREILALYYWESKTWREVAETVNCNVGQVQDKRYCGIEKMRRVMKIPIETYGRIMRIVDEKNLPVYR